MNLMNRLKVDGEWIYDQEQIREAAKQFYTNLNTDHFSSWSVLEGVGFDRIEGETSRRLEKPFSREEIWVALTTMEEYKALGPNQLPIKFLLACWDVLREDVFAVFSKFHSKDKWCKSLSMTFIIIIPMKKGAAELKDFRSISLVGCIDKFSAKTLAI